MFAERLSEILKEKGISKKRLLSDLELGKNQFSYWSRTGSAPNRFTIQRISAYLGVSEEYLLGESDDPASEICVDLKQKLAEYIDIMTEEESAALLAFFDVFLRTRRNKP